MKSQLGSVMMNDREKPLRFCTEVPGFVKCNEIPAEGAWWIRVVSPERHDDVELVIQPPSSPAPLAGRQAPPGQGNPLTAFAVGDLGKEHERLAALGVRLTREPTPIGPVTPTVFDDTCGNLIQHHQEATP